MHVHMCIRVSVLMCMCLSVFVCVLAVSLTQGRVTVPHSQEDLDLPLACPAGLCGVPIFGAVCSATPWVLPGDVVP